MVRYCWILLLLTAPAIFSQNQNPCDSDKHKQFHFWVGNWNVFDTQGKLIGNNKIVKMHNNCVLQENWESKTSSNKGTSYNYFNLADQTWNQVWVDNSGYSLVLKGGLKNNSMVMMSELVSSKNGDYYNRVSWTENKDGSVTQGWDYINKEGKILQEVFKGIYKKK